MHPEYKGFGDRSKNRQKNKSNKIKGLYFACFCQAFSGHFSAMPANCA